MMNLGKSPDFSYISFRCNALRMKVAVHLNCLLANYGVIVSTLRIYIFVPWGLLYRLFFCQIVGCKFDGEYGQIRLNLSFPSQKQELQACLAT